MKRRISAAWITAGLSGIVLAAGSAAVIAQGDAVVPPVAVEQPVPDPPEGEFGPGPEGWAKVRYSVMPDGSTANVRVADSQPPRLPTDDIVSAVRQWRFDPATDDGTPIEWHNNLALIAFDIDEIPQEASPFFAAAYAEVGEQVTAERFDRAKTRNERMQRESVFRLYEVGLANVQLAAIEIGLGDHHAAYDAIRRATEPAVNLLTPEELATALQYRFAIELELGRVVEALETYERRVAIEPLQADEPMAQHARALAEAMSGQDEVTYAIKGRVDRDAWVHAPARRTFAVGDVDGTLRDIEVECNRRTATLPFQEDVEWAVPETWGACTLAFNGRRGTTFTLYELE